MKSVTEKMIQHITPKLFIGMRKPLLTADELELVKEFPSDNLNLIPKLVDFVLQVTELPEQQVEQENQDNFTSSSSALWAKLKSYKVLNKNQSATSRPIYYCSEDSFTYQPGDSFGFYPKLCTEVVDFILEKVSSSSSSNKIVNLIGPSEILLNYLPQYEILNGLQIKIRDLVSRLDMTSFPKKATLRTFAEYCQDLQESKILLFLSSRSGSDAYNRLRTEMFSITTLLSAFPSIKLSLEALVNLAGPLQPRYYSACRKQTGNSFQIVFNVTEMPVLEGNSVIKGICSSWLESLKQSSDTTSIPIIKRSISNFRLPTTIQSERPIIMIAAGTGLAPFIGFLEVLKGHQNDLKPFTWLIFGLRNCQDDFIFESELDKFKSSKTLSRLSLAPSRDPIEPKTYVQDVISKEKDEFYRLLTSEDALIYICGDELKMIKGVNDAILEIIMEKMENGITRKEAEGILLQWSKEKKIIRDIWV